MRESFIKELIDIAESDERVLLLTGDLGYLVLEPFAERFPERFFNMGVAEQNMMGVATGLAESGFVPFVYSIATFATLRPYEFIRNGPLLHRLPVRVVGVGGGVEYGSNGPSHWALEDMAVMRVQPEMMVLAPADHEQARSVLRATWDLPGPLYYRLGKDERTVVPGLNGAFHLGGVDILRKGTDVVFVCAGAITVEAVAAAESLAREGIDAGVVVVATINPAPTEALLPVLAAYPHILAVESHYINGGLGSMICEIVAENGLSGRVARCGVARLPTGISGSQAYMQQLLGISSEALQARARAALFRERSP